MMLFHAKALAGGWLGGRKAWDRTQLLAVEWGTAKSSSLIFKKKKYKGEIVQHLYPPFLCLHSGPGPPATACAPESTGSGISLKIKIPGGQCNHEFLSERCKFA